MKLFRQIRHYHIFYVGFKFYQKVFVAITDIYSFKAARKTQYKNNKS